MNEMNVTNGKKKRNVFTDEHPQLHSFFFILEIDRNVVKAKRILCLMRNELNVCYIYFILWRVS